ncbi:thioredoxin-domain-containing protein [Lentinula aciculospora]|uniref:Thioredoxin-domain-containing protein n=1 Tax=Lentinula aciculospora TaxID=153920 RepID=A0A9W9ALM8_9AGAR|nr:thioredoxin-domain-containing protein [Lentinula aciculospora]
MATYSKSAASSGVPFEVSSVSEWNSILRHAYANNQTVIADFHAEWCQPCKVIAPVYAKLASQQPFTYFLRVDVDGNRTRDIAKKYSITAMPTFVVIKRPSGDVEAGNATGKGIVVDKLTGADQYGLERITNTHASRAYAPPSTLPTPAAEKAKDTGNELFRKRQYSAAVDAYSNAIELSPDSGVLYANRALAYCKWIQSKREGADSPEARNALRVKQMKDGLKVTEMEERWGKGWVRLAEAILESCCKESMEYVAVELGPAGEKISLNGAEEALTNAIRLSEGKVKTGELVFPIPPHRCYLFRFTEAQSVLENVQKAKTAL